MNSTPTIRALVLSTSVLALTAGSTFAQQIKLPRGLQYVTHQRSS